MDKAQGYYKHFGANIKYNNNLAAEHSFPTDLAANKNPCDFFGPPYINNCGYDAAGDLLNHIVPGGMKNQRNMNWQSAGTLSLFDQTEFVDPLYVYDTSSLDTLGYVYIPNSCQTNTCKVHVAIHGCHQGRATLDSTYATNTGYLEWAASNDLIILFPQVKANDLKPKGCWDFWGYTGVDYASNLAVQTSAIKGMVDRLTSAKSNSFLY